MAVTNGQLRGLDAEAPNATVLHKNPNLTTDRTDDTDLHGSENSIEVFEFVNPFYPCLSVVRFAFCAKQMLIGSEFRLRAAISKMAQEEKQIPWLCSGFRLWAHGPQNSST